MTRVVVQFSASSNMGAVSKDIARINAELGALAAKIAAIGAANPDGMKSISKTLMNDINTAKNGLTGFQATQMSAKTATARLTDEINRQSLQMKDLGKVKKNLNALTQQQMALRGSSAMITGLDTVNGRAIGSLVTPTTDFSNAAGRAAVQAQIMGKAIEAAGIQGVNAGKKMQWTGRQLSTGLTTPIVAVGAVSAKAAYDIDAAMVRLTKVYGDLGTVAESELQSVREATMETAAVVAREYGIAGKATVTLAADLAAAGYKGEELQKTTREIQRISLLGELDQQKAMDATRTIQTVFGVSTTELANKFNYLNAVENQTNTTLQDLTEVIPRTASVVKELGGSLEDSAVFTVAFKEAGIDAVQGANALRSSLGAITAPSMVAQKKLMALGIDIRKIAKENHPDNGGRGLVAMLQELGSELEGLGGLAKTEALATLFGRYQFNKMSGLLKGLSENANDTSTQVGRAFDLMGASAADLAKEADDEIGQIQMSLSGKLRAAGASIVLELAKIGQPILKYIVVPIAQAFNKVLSIINGLPGVIKGTIAVMLGIAALAGPIMFFAGIFKVLYFSTVRWYGAIMRGRKGMGDLLTANEAFSAHASSVVIPSVTAETAAIQKLGAAFELTAAAAMKMAGANTAAAASATAAAAAPVKPRYQYPAGYMSGARTDVAGGGGKNMGGKFAPDRPANMAPMIMGTKGAQDLKRATDGATASAGRLSTAWRAAAGGIATAGFVGLIFANQMEGAMKTVMQSVFALMILFGLMPGLFIKIATSIRLMATAAYWGVMLKNMKRVILSFKAWRAGAVGATVVTRALGLALKAALGPIALLVAGIGIAVFMWHRNKKKMEENRKEAEHFGKAAQTLAGIVGFEYSKAGQVSAGASDLQKKSLVELGKEWIKTGKSAEVASLKMKKAADDEGAVKRIAESIGQDARAHGATAQQALDAARIALTTAGFSDEEVRKMFPTTSQFASVEEAMEYEIKELGTAFRNYVEKEGKKGNDKDQFLRDFGAKFADRIDGDKQVMFTAMDELKVELDAKLAELLGNVELSKDDKSILGDLGLMNGDKLTEDTERLRHFFQVELPEIRKIPMGSEGSLGIAELGTVGRLELAYNKAAEAEMRLVDSMKTALNINRESNKYIDTRAELEEHLAGNTIRIKDAQADYNDELARALFSGRFLTEEEKLQILNKHRLAAGLNEAGKSTDNFGKSTSAASKEAEELNAILEEGAETAAQFAQSMKSKIGENISSAISQIMDQFDEQTEAGKSNLDTQSKMWEDAFDLRVKDSEKAFDLQERQMDEAFDAEEDRMESAHAKAIEDAEKVRDGRVKAIEDEMDKADKLDEKRKKMFEAEMTRIQRLASAANRNIDFNIALKTGNLDEAARITEAAYADEVSNAMKDAGDGMDVEAERRRAAGESKIRGITTAEDARIARIKNAQDVEKKAFEDRRAMREQELKDAQDKQKAAFDSEKENRRRRDEIVKKSYEAERAERRRVTEEHLKQMAIEIPATEKGQRELMNNLKGYFQEATGENFKETKRWNQLHENGFKTAMADTRRELKNAREWEKVGKESIDAMTQGMLGMTFAEFANWMKTGDMPTEKKKPPVTAAGGTTLPNGDIKVPGGTLPVRHSGGPVSDAVGSRAGRPMNAPLYPDEVPTILQKGEFVVQKKAVDKIGAGTLSRINQGQTSFYHEGGIVGAVGAKIMSQFVPLSRLAIEMGAQRKAAELSAEGRMDDIPEALKFVAAAAKAGQYGNTNLDDIQLRNAATILSVGRSMGATEKDLVVAIMTALQESSLRNLASRKMPGSMMLPNEGTAPGDADSVGLFQQRTSQGWGSVKELMDPATSARKFFEVLLKQKGREDQSPAAVAQRVQRSADGSLYAKWEDEAKAIIAASAAAAGVGGEQYNKGGTFRAFGGTVTGDIQGLQVEFLNRLARWSAEMGTPYPVGSGYRSMAEQQILYNRWLARVPGQAPAAPPGRSNHNFGLASDGPRWGARNPGKFGLEYPMSYEPWHIEPIGAKGMRVPQMAVGGHVNYDNTIANLHKNETVLTAPLSQKLNEGINKLDSGSNVSYNITVNGAGADAETVATKVLQKIQRMEQVKGPKRVIR